MALGIDAKPQVEASKVEHQAPKAEDVQPQPAQTAPADTVKIDALPTSNVGEYQKAAEKVSATEDGSASSALAENHNEPSAKAAEEHENPVKAAFAKIFQLKNKATNPKVTIEEVEDVDAPKPAKHTGDDPNDPIVEHIGPSKKDEDSPVRVGKNHNEPPAKTAEKHENPIKAAFAKIFQPENKATNPKVTIEEVEDVDAPKPAKHTGEYAPNDPIVEYVGTPKKDEDSPVGVGKKNNEPPLSNENSIANLQAALERAKQNPDPMAGLRELDTAVNQHAAASIDEFKADMDAVDKGTLKYADVIAKWDARLQDHENAIYGKRNGQPHEPEPIDDPNKDDKNKPTGDNAVDPQAHVGPVVDPKAVAPDPEKVALQPKLDTANASLINKAEEAKGAHRAKLITEKKPSHWKIAGAVGGGLAVLGLLVVAYEHEQAASNDKQNKPLPQVFNGPGLPPVNPTSVNGLYSNS